MSLSRHSFFSCNSSWARCCHSRESGSVSVSCALGEEEEDDGDDDDDEEEEENGQYDDENCGDGKEKS